MNDSKSKSRFSFKVFTNPHSQTTSRFYKGIPTQMSISFVSLLHHADC